MPPHSGLGHPECGGSKSLQNVGINLLRDTVSYTTILDSLFPKFVRSVVLTLQCPVVTICTNRFNIHKFYVLPTQCIYVFCTDL
jgi:hypothetical protein